MIDNCNGLWIPANDAYLRERLSDRSVDWIADYDADLFAFVAGMPRRRVAIDVGASVGLWSMKLAQMFGFVHAFEPNPIAAECFVRNVNSPQVHLRMVALGDRNGKTSIVSTPGISFKTFVGGSIGTVDMMTLDSYAFDSVDLIKIDCEGFDFYVLQGAMETIKRERPMIIFESKPGVSQKRYKVEQNAARDMVARCGYDVLRELHGNVVCIPDELK